MKKKYNVAFFDIAEVILIPCKNEYHEAKMADSLWYSDLEFELMKDHAKEQLKVYMEEKEFDPELCDKAAFKEISNELYDDPEYCESIDQQLQLQLYQKHIF